jgi:hypothetical protein
MKKTLIILFILSNCGRAYVKHTDIDPKKCDTKSMVSHKIIKADKWLKGSEAKRIINAYRQCLLYIESVNDANRKAAKYNRPDGFWQDLQEFGSGVGVGALITAIAVAL